MMGSPENEKGRYDDEGPQHEVHVEDFWLADTPVTQMQYQTVMGGNPSHFTDHSCNPVECVSWEDAMAFCEKLSKRTGRRFTLPGEAQWEYACRAGKQTRYCYGDDERELIDHAWYDANSNNKTHPVGLKRPNAWGLYDMHGNVWEWCLDHWHDNDKEAPNDGVAWTDKEEGAGRVFRGGGWVGPARYCRSASRYGCAPDFRDDGLGFRVLAVRSQPASAG